MHDGYAGPISMVDGREVMNFASYNYLGLNRHPEVAEAAKRAIDHYGVSVSASRVVGGERPIHRDLEHALAKLLGVEAAAVFVSGHATNVTTLGTLLGTGDLVLLDALAHNSLFEGARLSGATRMTFPHNDWPWIEETLAKVRGRFANVLICVEGLYSMDGDVPDLARLIALKNQYNAWLMIDEAHSLGVLGDTGRGLAESQGIEPRTVEIWMGTLSKTLSASGGYIAGSGALIDYLKARAPGFVFSVGLAAPLAAAAEASVRLMLREPGRVQRLRANGLLLRDALRKAGLNTGLSLGYAITPVILGDSVRAAIASHLLFESGVNALPIIYPAVSEKQARLRFFVTSEHEPQQIEHAVELTAAAVSAAEDRAFGPLGG